MKPLALGFNTQGKTEVMDSSPGCDEQLRLGSQNKTKG